MQDEKCKTLFYVEYRNNKELSYRYNSHSSEYKLKYKKQK